jgi:hypothetical protein
MVAAHDLEEPSVDVAMMTRAAESILARTAQPSGGQP